MKGQTLKMPEEHSPHVPEETCPECGQAQGVEHFGRCSRHPKNWKCAEPLPCPLCHGADLDSILDEEREFRVECNNCGTRGPSAYYPFDAYERWNTRADPTSSKQSLDSVSRQEAALELQIVLDNADEDSTTVTTPIFKSTLETALLALNDKVLIPYIGEVSG